MFFKLTGTKCTNTEIDHFANDYELNGTKCTNALPVLEITGTKCIIIIIMVLFYLFIQNYAALKDFHSVSSGSRDISMLLSLFQFLFFIIFFFHFFVSFPSSFFFPIFIFFG